MFKVAINTINQPKYYTVGTVSKSNVETEVIVIPLTHKIHDVTIERLDALKGVIRSRKSKDRPRNDHSKTDKRTNDDLQNITQI